ncbi:MAG TPA: protein kinase [Bryobacteraceae bacterium]|jgi:Tol biopolymer transport system component
MTDEQWQTALKLYQSGGSLPPEQIEAFLNDATSDHEIREAVLEMFAGAQPVEPLDRIGQKIGRYVITHRLGEGGMGEVFGARDTELGRPVAIKFLYAESSATAPAERFISEAKAASALNHPNIVTIYEVIHSRSRLAIVMELVDGVALRRLCGTPMPVDRVLDIGAQAARALRAAHASGIVHCDIKPENLMVRPDGLVKVLDFGLARDLGAASSQSVLPAGTLRYMSPEQSKGAAPTGASDVFSLGIVLYELAAGAHPFERGSIFETLTALNQGDPPAPSTLNAYLPRQFDNLIAAMLAKNPSQRPQASEVARVLESGFRGEPALPIAALKGKAQFRIKWLVAAMVVLAALSAGLFLRKSRSAAGEPIAASDLQISPLASLRGTEREPSISRDGARVAFVFSNAKDPTGHIYIKSLSDGKLTRLTSDALADSQPVFSPDGTRVAFLRRSGARLRIMLTPSNGGVEEQAGEVMNILFTNPAVGGREVKVMTWDGDGQNLLVADRVAPSRFEIAIFQISVETGARRQMTFPPPGAIDWMPEISPDGRTLGFARMGIGYNDLWLMPAGGGSPRRFNTSKEVFFCWQWTADGREVLVSYLRSGQAHLWREPVAGGPQVRVAGLDDQVMDLSVARSGNFIVYGSGGDEDFNVWHYAIPPSKDTPKPLIASAAFDGDARYSPDGAHIAFASSRSGRSQIWICSSDGSDARQMTSLDTGFDAGSPNWSPDGRWIAFDLRSPKGESSIFLLDVLGGKPKQITGPGPHDMVPGWSRDSHWIYFSSDRSGDNLEIWKVPSSASSGGAVQVTHSGGFQGVESPDGRFLYYSKRRQLGIWRAPLQGGAAEQKVAGLEAIGNRYWDASAQGIYFAAPSKAPELKLFHFSNGEVTHVVDLLAPPAQSHQGISVSPDGRGFLYLQTDPAATNLMVGNRFH